MMRVIVTALVLCSLSGCGSRSMEPADLSQAGPALRTALEAWKAGKSKEEFESQKPPIVMNEDDWRVGKRLLDFQMEEQGSLSGRQVVWRAEIKLQDDSGKTEERKATYLIDTTPRLVIVRNPLAR
jgi:hypothetical protein